MESPLALYRRYRPETFAEVIGQDHVTEPLRAALANDRVNHAYLFSGPRGCGKTTSARILARSLNCARGPIADPCGECDSCRDLARGGGGSIDVIEIDAASHGGVDDARDLREKAFFAPVRDKYKIYIIDEAHMVSTQGFNALLKLVEEPPPHLRFIFATTEPDKVLPTIRSRTHHYPFRLIPPRLLSDYLGQLCEQEGVAIEPAALPLVVRAGGGSARDTLSVLDQLIGGAGPDGVTHALATGLLGFTPETLLDEVVDAFAARDGGAVFGVVDKVVETGQDPRRFTEDLLRRLRDLVIVAAVPEAPASGLIDVAEDAGERLVAQAARFGAIELSRAADIVAAGLTEMRGATAPRLLLELICARVLLPGADHTSDGVMARLERLERRMDVTGGAPATAPVRPAPPVAPPTPAPTAPAAAAPTPGPAPSSAPAPSTAPAPAPETAPAPQTSPAPAAAPTPAASAPATPATGSAAEATPASTSGGSTLSLVDVRRLWPDIVEQTKRHRRLVSMILSQGAQVVSVDARTLTIGFANAGARGSFTQSGCDEIVRQSAIDVVGHDWRIETIVDPGAADAERPVVTKPSTPSQPGPEAPAPQTELRERPGPSQQAPAEPPGWASEPSSSSTPAPPQGSAAPPPAEPPGWATGEAPPAPGAGGNAPVTGIAAAREAMAAASQQSSPADDGPDPRALADAEASPDDPDAETAGLDSAALLQQALGAEVIEEIDHR
ncbi:DNA polymerase III subunit gamma/tau [Nocardioides gansuensis]|uniref:DNA polymerase III subunit gamma/tau n=1 Tax=Nocardioides gansuensis TaxID=2138300 RepID=A0A2T8F9J1_9ACTN|nr:DNA polymerase III subunit gamma and tau [Nocardioides gansuensis]PVG82382.1 DNA polymerase III subunit gamma/tau [Nocardioides gansuensis]